MRIATLVLLSIPAATLAIPSAQAALVISTNATRNMSCTKGQCTATAANAVMNVSVLENAVSFADDTISTGGAAKDIVIDAAISWTSANRLTLTAQRSIVVNAAVSDAGSGGLTLNLDSAGHLSFGAGGHIGFWSTSDSFVVNGITYMLVNSVGSLKGAFLSCPNCKVALAGNYDATPDGTYPASPVDQIASPGVFEGLGNTISNLSIDDLTIGDWVGLFATVADGGTIENLRLTKVNVHATGSPSNYASVGGLVGLNVGTLVRDSVGGKVGGNYVDAGGLVGQQTNDSIEGSYSSASVSGTGAGRVGGLAGWDCCSIINSHAAGKITAADGMDAGGLIGRADTAANVWNAHATGSVSGGADAHAGGLIGYTEYAGMCGYFNNGTPTISKSYATGTVTGGDNSHLGGLVGEMSGCTIQQSYATGTVGGTQGVVGGGLVGWNAGSLKNTYATGGVSSSYSGNIGGLIGYNGGTAAASYSTGGISGDLGGSNGGLIGTDTSQNVAHTYWDTTTSGIASSSQGAGTPANDPGIAPRTTNQLKSALPKGFSSSIWGEKSTVNGGLPYLRAVPPG